MELQVQFRRPARAADLVEAWPEVVLPMTPYLAVCDWPAPVDPSIAARVLFEDGRIPFLVEDGGRPVIAVLQRYRLDNMAALAVLSPSGPEIDSIGSVATGLVRLAVDTLGVRRCEWRLLRTWRRARAAAGRIGFQEEVCLPEACVAGRCLEDVILTGLMAEELAAS